MDRRHIQTNQDVSDTLKFTIQKIQSLTDGNEALKEKIALLEPNQMEMTRRLQEELKETGGRERLVTFKFHTLCQLNEANQKMQRTAEQRKSLCKDLEANLKQKDNQIQALEEKIALLEDRQTEVNHLQEKVREKDDLLKREVRERRLSTLAHILTLALLDVDKKKLQRTEEQWKSRRDGPESNLIQTDNQPQTPTKEQLVTKAKRGQEEMTMTQREENEKMREEEKEGEKETEEMDVNVSKETQMNDKKRRRSRRRRRNRKSEG